METTRTSVDSIGLLLRGHRARAGLSQEDLAARSGLSPRAIRKIESDQSRPRLSTLRLLGEALDLSSAERETLAAAVSPETVRPEPPSRDPLAVPAQLPNVTTLFSGRDAELATVVSYARPGNVVVVSGMAGVGKSSLAVHAARRLAPEYPDGQLFLNLRGFSTTEEPVSPAEALDRMLRGLGVRSDHIPQDIEDRAAAFRTVTAQRRVLVTLDNVADAGQLLPLLPGAASGSTVLVTSRRTLAEVHDAQQVTLNVLNHDTTVEILAAAAGITDSVPHDELDEVARICDGLPLAVRLAAAKLKSRPQWTPTHLLRSMASPSRLMELHVGQESVAAALNATYHALPEPHRRLFRMLGTFPGPNFDRYVAAALRDAPLDETEAMLEDLVDVHLLQTDEPERYHFHDLIREFAVHIAQQEDPEERRRFGFGRVLQMYVAAVSRTGKLIGPHQVAMLPEPDIAPARYVPAIPDHPSAIAWCQTEHDNVLAVHRRAVEEGMIPESLGLAARYRPFLNYHTYYDDLVKLCRESIWQVEQLGDRQWEAQWTSWLGAALHNQEAAEAEPVLLRALELTPPDADHERRISVLNQLGNHFAARGRLPTSLTHFEEAIQLADRWNSPLQGCIVRNNCAHSYKDMGLFDQARTHLEHALRALAELDNPRELARTHYNLGNLVLAENRPQEALESHRRALEYCQSHNETDGLGHALLAMAMDFRRLGRLDEAEAHWKRAAALAEQGQSRIFKSVVRCEQGRILLAQGKPAAAVTAFTAARSHVTGAHAPHNEALALHGLGVALAAQGAADAGARHRADGIARYEACGVSDAEHVLELLYATDPEPAR